MRQRASSIVLKSGKEVFSDLKPAEVKITVREKHKLIVSELKRLGIWQTVAIELSDIKRVSVFVEVEDKMPKPKKKPRTADAKARDRESYKKYLQRIKKDNFNKQLGLAIKQLRLSKGFSYQYLAALCNVHPKTINRYELGTARITDKRLKQFAQVFKCSVDDIKRQAKKLKIDQQPQA